LQYIALLFAFSTAPLQVAGTSYNHSTDLWSLGISTFEMLFGMTPFEPNSMLSEDGWRAAVKDNILASVLRFPASGRAPLAARLFVKSMLALSPGNRLYGEDCPEYDRVKKHPFFAKFDWRALYSRTLAPPSLYVQDAIASTDGLRNGVGTKL
jgi:serine/threonine protein kinase